MPKSSRRDSGTNPLDRRGFLTTAAAATAASAVPYIFTADAEARARATSKNDRFRIASIGMRYQGSVIAHKAAEHGDIVAICDVDREIAEKAREDFGGKADLYERLSKDARAQRHRRRHHRHARPLAHRDRSSTPAGRARTCYCEKPLTLTIDEGKLDLQGGQGDSGACVAGRHAGSGATAVFRLAVETGPPGPHRQADGRVTSHPGQEQDRRRAVSNPRQDPPAHLDWDALAGANARDVPYIPRALPLHISAGGTNTPAAR